MSMLHPNHPMSMLHQVMSVKLKLNKPDNIVQAELATSILTQTFK